VSAGTRLVVVGDALLDREVHGSVDRLSPDAPVPVLDEGESGSRPGGAGLAAALAAREGRPVTLVTALAADSGAAELRAELDRLAVEVVDLGLAGSTPEKVRFLAGGRPLLRLDRGGAPESVGRPSAAARAAIGRADAVLVSDYGRGVARQPELRAAIAERRMEVPVVWDPHPRGPAPVPGLAVATPNEKEAKLLCADSATDGVAASADRGDALRRAWDVGAVCVTRGPRGAVLSTEGAEPLALPAGPAPGGDPCGAGDRFASRLACALGDGRPLAESALEAVAVASAFVAAGGARRALRPGETPVKAESDPVGVAQRVRAAGGTVVATGGCFDLLHAGHLRTLEAARGLGDCLVVCLNSDASVRRLKGPHRPVVPQSDRASVLSALGCVDGVVIFDEDTPERALRSLRPHVWAKGGDYEGAGLPEAAALAEWGGRSVVLPYVTGLSTTRLIEEAASRA
jgi:D-beta-D-heptose 7-phosphate kinase / D-beta-D-heptose 1-phosphate adenosyltransferase